MMGKRRSSVGSLLMYTFTLLCLSHAPAQAELVNTTPNVLDTTYQYLRANLRSADSEGDTYLFSRSSVTVPQPGESLRSQSNCTVSGFELPGQKLHLIGATNLSEQAGNSRVSPDQVAAYYPAIEELPAKVTLVIVDKFDDENAHGNLVYSHTETILSKLRDSSRSVFLVKASIGEGEKTVETVQAIEKAIADAETEYVVVNMSFVIVPCDVLDDAKAVGAKTFEEYARQLAADNEQVLLEFQATLNKAALASNADLRLAARDLDNSAVRELRNSTASPPNFQRLVTELGPDLFRQQVNQLLLGLAVPDSDSRKQERLTTLVERLLVQPVAVTDDPLLELVCDQSIREGVGCLEGRSVHNKKVVFVASAGNYAQPFPLYPAAFPTVIAVGSCDLPSPSRRGQCPANPSGFSNFGQLLAPGASFALTGSDGKVEAYEGTSFAAPEVSIFIARLLGSNLDCVSRILDLPKVGNYPLEQPVGTTFQPKFSFSCPLEIHGRGDGKPTSR